MKKVNLQNRKIDAFSANSDAFRAVCAEIVDNAGSSIPQPVLIIGQEGSGKTTLLKRVISTYSNLNSLWIDGRTIFSSADIINKVSDNSLLVIDNLDYYLHRCTYEEQFKLRRFLYNEGAPMLIATVNKLLKSLTEYKAPFFEGLKKIHLSPITIEEITDLVDKKSMGRFVDMFSLVPPTIKSVEIISNIIELNSNSEDDIDSLISYFSSKYKLIYQSVPVYSQNILNILSASDLGLTIPEIRHKSNLASGTLTAYLKSLSKQDVISADKSIKRNTKYYVKDPLFRIWLKQ